MNWLIRSRLKILYCLIRLRSQNQNYLELELSITREQINRFASSKLDHMLSIQKSYLDKSGLGFVDSIFVSETHSTNFVSSSKPSKIEVVKPKEDVPAPRKIGVDLTESKPKSPKLPKDNKHDIPLWVYHFCGKARCQDICGSHVKNICHSLL